MKVFQDISRTVGNTPLVRLNRISEGASVEIYAKLEFYNPTSSVKDRIAVNMIDDAERKGVLKEGGVIVEPTSGNTGLGLAMVAASRGYKLIITMPDTMSLERRNLMKFLGAELVLTEGAKGMKGAIEKAVEIVSSTPGAFMPAQFDNPANPEIHFKTTGPEIWNDLEGRVDIFIAGVGTGGTITGTGRFLRSKNKEVEIIAVEPETSAVLSGDPPGKHGIQGIGAGFVPGILEKSLINRIVRVGDNEALETSRKLARLEGILCGISAGAAVWTALRIASEEKNKGKNIVVVLPDTGERYMSTALFA